jgi:hypothetical protein
VSGPYRTAPLVEGPRRTWWEEMVEEAVRQWQAKQDIPPTAGVHVYSVPSMAPMPKPWCLHCERPVDEMETVFDAFSDVRRMELRCHGRTELRTVDSRWLRLGRESALERLLAPAFSRGDRTL